MRQYPMPTIMNEMLALMREKQWPVSVQETILGAIELAQDERAAAEKVWDILHAVQTPKEAVKAIQPLLK